MTIAMETVETKEERRARRAAKKGAKAEHILTKNEAPDTENPAVPEDGKLSEESKEERRARKEAKKMAKLAAKSVEAEAASNTIPSTSQLAVEGTETKDQRKARRKAENQKMQGNSSLVSPGAAAVAGSSKSSLPLEASNATSKASDEVTRTENPKKDKKRKRDETEIPVVEPETLETSEDPSGKVDQKKRKNDQKEVKKRTQRQDTRLGEANEGKSESARLSTNHTSETLGNTTPPSDVFSDSSLSDQAKKALYYVQSHALYHAVSSTNSTTAQTWKFNKARQNWLIRNVWNGVEVPESYFDGVVAYLKTVQGSSRTNLIQEAEKIVKMPERSLPDEEVPVVTNDQVTKASEGTAEATEMTATPERDPDVLLRRERAQKILKALNP